MRGEDKENEPVHYDSRVDKFNKRMELVQTQWDKGDTSVLPAEVKNLSMYEFWWKYSMWKGRLKRATRGVCLMVTPAYSADCAFPFHQCWFRFRRS